MWRYSPVCSRPTTCTDSALTYVNMYIAGELALHGDHCIKQVDCKINQDKMLHSGNQEVDDATAASGCDVVMDAVKWILPGFSATPVAVGIATCQNCGHLTSTKQSNFSCEQVRQPLQSCSSSICAMHTEALPMMLIL